MGLEELLFNSKQKGLVKYKLLQRFTLAELRECHKVYIDDREEEKKESPAPTKSEPTLIERLFFTRNLITKVAGTPRQNLINAISTEMTLDELFRFAENKKIKVDDLKPSTGV